MSEIKIKVNDKDVPLSEFPEKIFKNTLFAMLETLKGVEKIENFEIKFEK